MTLSPTSSEPSRKYRIIAQIGRGGMGEVCLAVARGAADFTKLVVLKRARPDMAEEPEVLAMFLDEARLAARLNHPNVVQTYEAGEEDGRFYIAMEYLEGQSLREIRRRVKPIHFPLSMQIRILIEALSGLHYAHELADFDGMPLGMVHRDATPQNIFVTYDGLIKVVDFGIAKAANSTIKTGLGIMKGKVTYMAPEQARCEPLDRRTDIFAVGIMLWEAITGERLWQGLTNLEIITRLSKGKIPSPPNKYPELKNICQRALAPARDKRYATAAELQYELERWLVKHGDEIPARMVGRFVALHFEEERNAMKARIERELRDYCPPSVSSRGKAPDATEPEVKIESQRPVVTDAPDPIRPSNASMSTKQEATLRSSQAPSEPPPASEHGTLRQSSVSLDSGNEPVSRPRSWSRGRRPLVLGGAVAIAGAAAVASFTFKGPLSAWIEGHSPMPASSGSNAEQGPAGTGTQSSPTPGSSQAPTASPSQAMASAPALAPSGSAQAAAPTGFVSLTVHVRPPTAQLFLDGVPVSAGYFKGKLAKDGREHRIRVEAPGFVTVEQPIAASGEVSINLSLERKPPSTP